MDTETTDTQPMAAADVQDDTAQARRSALSAIMLLLLLLLILLLFAAAIERTDIINFTAAACAPAI